MSTENTQIVSRKNGEGQPRQTALMANITPEQYKKMNEMLSGMDKMKPGINMVPEYLEFDEKGMKKRGIFMGFAQFDKVDESSGEISVLDSAVWMDADRNLWQNAGTQLVGGFSQINQGTPVEIEYLGTKKVKSGNMKRYAVRILNA